MASIALATIIVGFVMETNQKFNDWLEREYLKWQEQRGKRAEPVVREISGQLRPPA